jgi:putative oxidoreductase
VTRLTELWRSEWLTVRVQIALGVIFIAAALPKIVDPPSFAHMVYNYKMIPKALLGPMALTMPWVELLCGVALVLGIWRKTAAKLVGAMLIMFIVAISINLARGNAVNCGCFDVSSASKSQDELLAEMKWVIIRDVGMLVMVAQLLSNRALESRDAQRASGTLSLEADTSS